jgi:hypothetical protein
MILVKINHPYLRVGCNTYVVYTVKYWNSIQKTFLDHMLLYYRASISLGQVVGCLYLPLDQTHQFFLSISTTNSPETACISLQYLVHNYISISYIILIYSNQHHYSKFKRFI